MDPDMYRESFLATQCLVSPWHRWLDGDRYRATRVTRADEPGGRHGEDEPVAGEGKGGDWSRHPDSACGRSREV
jgi:hypothetical protein